MIHLLRYPNSFRKLLILGLTLVALPLVTVLVGNVVSIRELSNKSVRAVHLASRATQASRAMLESLTAQERALRQFLVLDDDTLWQGYLAQHRRFAELAEQLAAIPQGQELQRGLAGLVGAERDMNEALATAQAATTPLDRRRMASAAAAGFGGLNDLARNMLSRNQAEIDRQVEELRDLAASAESTMIYQLLALLPAVGYLVYGFTRLLAGPIAQLAAAIGGLRAGRLERSIAVDGPRDLQALGEELDRLRLRLIRLEEQKGRFLQQVSHELKTPLTALREGADLLADGTAGALTPAQREITDILRDNSLRLRSLIEDLLSYSAAEFEQTALRRQRFPLPELVEAVVERQRLAWHSRGLTIDLQIADLALNADRERLRTVLDNLLSNAVKFSPTGGTITIRARVDQGEACLEVADQGPGIATTEASQVFDPFFQGAARQNGAVAGSGLGLSIAREHVLAHGGKLLAHAGPGARFELRLPLE